MKKPLAFSDLDISFIPPVLLEDKYWQECINLALKSGSENQRYGALVVAGNEITGRGWNRLLERNEKFPFRTSFFLHGEKAAMGDAILKNGEKFLKDATLYVAGIFVDEKRPFIRSAKFINTNTCVSCTKFYVKFGLNAAFYTENGWEKCSGLQAYNNALANSRLIRERKITPRQYRKEISL